MARGGNLRAGPAGNGGGRVLVLAAVEIAGEGVEAVVDEVRRIAGDEHPDVRVVSPVLASSGLKQTLGDLDDAVEPARRRLESSLSALRGAGLEATGEVGDSDPVTAISDELQKFPIRRILVLTHARDDERAHVEKDLIERIDREFDPPATELLVTGPDDRARISGRQQASAGAKRRWEGRRFSPNLPPFRKQDLLGIGVAVVGTIVLLILAASCSDSKHEQGGPLNTIAGGCAARYLIAGAFFLINLGHVGALLLMESVGYKGPFERLFARLTLIGTPLAILISALI